MEAEEWNLVEAVANRADRSLDATACILGNFGEVVAIVRSSMTHELIPRGQVHMILEPAHFVCHFSSSLTLVSFAAFLFPVDGTEGGVVGHAT